MHPGEPDVRFPVPPRFPGNRASPQEPSPLTATPASAAKSDPSKFRYCLNTSTIRGQKLPLDQEIDLAAKAGYDGIEPWIREIDAYVKGGGKVSELRKQIDGHGLKVESAIGFAQWIVDDDEKRKDGLETAKRDMDLLRQLGGTHIAAPPVGAHRGSGPVDLFKAAERYRALLEVGAKIGVTPQVEVWGFSDNLSRLGEATFVAIEAGASGFVPPPGRLPHLQRWIGTLPD